MVSDKAISVLALLQRVVRTGNFTEVDRMDLKDMYSAKYELACEQGTGPYKLLTDRIRMKEDAGRALQSGAAQPSDYVHTERIAELQNTYNTMFDLCKLIQLCNELNLVYGSKCYYSVGMLVRAICDHVPPVFECNSFSEIANNYAGSKSFKKGAQALNDSLRNRTDGFLHQQIRKAESLPNENSVSFSPDLDLILEEVIRILKAHPATLSR